MIADDVRSGLTACPKTLPPHLFYDEEGTRLYERITTLPEYYLTRAERSIFEAEADAIVAGAAHDRRPLCVVELGAGSATKTELLLRAVLRRQARCVYIPVDVSPTAIEAARVRLAAELPAVRLHPLVTTHDHAPAALSGVEGPALLLFIGSSVGNFEDDAAAHLLRSYRDAMGGDATLLLGTDLRKSPDVLLPAYDDAEGVTAAFDKNLLTRINRELGGHFDLERFRHLARWNDRASRVEMHLESTVAQTVRIDELALDVGFDAGETIHTESSIKYDLPRVDRLLASSGFRRKTTFQDREGRFAVHLAPGA